MPRSANTKYQPPERHTLLYSVLPTHQVAADAFIARTANAIARTFFIDNLSNVDGRPGGS